MPYCEECGAEVEEGADFCPECGASIGGKGGARPRQVTSLMPGSLMTRGRAVYSIVIGFLLMWISWIIFIVSDGESALEAGTIIYSLSTILVSSGLILGGIDKNKVSENIKRVMVIMGVIALILLSYAISVFAGVSQAAAFL